MASVINFGKNDVERLLHAIDLAILGDWEGAKRSIEDLDNALVSRLQALMTEEQRREKERGDRIVLARHELGNALSVAQANVEGMVDGLLEPTADRLQSIRDALQSAGAFLLELRKDPPPAISPDTGNGAFNICELLAAQAQFIASVAQAKNVLLVTSVCEPYTGACDYAGDRELVAQTIRGVLLTAVRVAQPGGEIRAGCAHPSGELLVSILSPGGADAFAKMLAILGTQARAADLDAERASFFISLPTVAQHDVAPSR